jgi:hypothetical protein
MHTLRSSKTLAGLVLVWFALFLGSAIASTSFSSGSMQIICAAGGGMKMVDTGDDGSIPKAGAGMDCPLCATCAPPPSKSSAHFDPRSPLAHALQPLAAAHIASTAAPPLPSRGPPRLS